DTETLQARWSVSDRDRRQSWSVLSVDGYRVSTDDCHTVVIWDTATGRELSRLSVGENVRKFLHIALSRDGRKLLVGQRPRWSVFDLASGPSIPPRKLGIEKPEQHELQQAVFSPNGWKLAVRTDRIGGDPEPVTIWESATGRHLATYPGRPLGSYQILFAPGGESVLLNGGEAVQRWWFERTRD